MYAVDSSGEEIEGLWCRAEGLRYLKEPELRS